MADSQQRSDYVAAQIAAIHQNLRFLEAVVREPIGLTTDLKSLRESLDAPGAGEERDRQAFLDIIEQDRNPEPVGLAAAALASKTIALLMKLAPRDEPGAPLPWVARATKVLDRITTRLGGEARRRKAESLRGGLYVIVDPEHTNRRPVPDVAAAALAGGAAAIQLRDKRSDKADILAAARELRALCASSGALFFANDDADIARLGDCDGLHAGQTDLPTAEARRILNPHQLVGRSNTSLEEALVSEADSADYVAIGAIYATGTKATTRLAGLDALAQTAASIGVPVAAIGGINEANIGPVLEAGADCVCVISAVCGADDPEAAARRLAELIDEAAR